MLAASITSSSLIDPPGWIIAVTPASAAAISPSAKGKNASEATTDPTARGFSKSCIFAASSDFRAAILDESSLFICPAPIPTVEPSFAYTIAFDLTCLVTLKANKRSAISWSDGCLLVTTFRDS